MRAPAALAALLPLLALAGCLAPAAEVQPQSQPEAGPGAPREPAAPPRGALPLLAPGSALREEPWGYQRASWQAPAEPLPVLLTMDGYEGASGSGAPTHYLRVRDGVLVALHAAPDGDYLRVHGSLRGTGCSGGAFELFGLDQAMDGHEVVEWLARQPWSTGKVGLEGGSYPGITAFLIASTAPPSLAAVHADLLVADLYRDIAAPGGVPNGLFPRFWTLAVRPLADAQGTLGGARALDEVCLQNAASRPPPEAAEHPAHQLGGTTDNDWYRARSLLNHARGIRAPISISHAWQDEQTGPRAGPLLHDAVHPDPVRVGGAWVEPKRLVATNGYHGTGARADADAGRWFDHWLRGLDTGLLQEPPVRLLVGARITPAGLEAGGALALDAFPSRDTAWERWFLHEDLGLRPEAPPGDGSLSYVAGASTQNWGRTWYLGGPRGTPPIDPVPLDLPDRLTFRSPPADAPRVLAGPIAATLHLATTAPDTDLYLALGDQGPDGTVYELARGILRASHRALDPARTQYNDAGDIVRPHHPHTNPLPVEPGAWERYEVEVSPLVHVLYPGHSLVLQVGNPPLLAGLWGYEPSHPPAVNTLATSPERPSSLLLPWMDWPGGPPPEPPCGAPDGYRCVPGAAGLPRHKG